MHPLLNIIEQGMLMSNLSAAKQSSNKPRGQPVMYSMVMILSSLAYILMMSGLSLWMLQSHTIPVVLMATGGIVLATALAILGAWWAMRIYKGKQIEKTIRALLDESNEAVNSLTARLDETFGENVGKAILAAALGGYVISRRLI